MYQTFIDKETAINKAIDRVKAKLKSYSDTPDQPHKDWNLWHDLQDRLEARLADNWSNYKSWHWETYQFNTY